MSSPFGPKESESHKLVSDHSIKEDVADYEESHDS
jgi:hypothetical protein